MTSSIRQLVTDQLEAAGVDPSTPETGAEIVRLELAGIVGASGTQPTKWEAIYWALGEQLCEDSIRAIGMRDWKILFAGRDTDRQPDVPG